MGWMGVHKSLSVCLCVCVLAVLVQSVPPKTPLSFFFLDGRLPKKGQNSRKKCAKSADNGDLLKISQIFSAKMIDFHV